MNSMLRSLCLVALGATLLVPRPAAAQQSDGWKVDFAPLYFWATELDGQMKAGPVTVPIFLEFADAADHLGGAFSFHLEARKGRWGLLTDLNFVRLSSESTFTVASKDVTGTFKLDNVIFEAGASYLVSPEAQLALIGGLRTYTVAPKLEFATASTSAAPIDASQTSANGFVGVTLRPKLSNKMTLISRADIGGGDAHLTWSAEAGFEFTAKPWLGLAFGYKALGIDVRHEDLVVKQYDVTHYGPIFGADLHWGR